MVFQCSIEAVIGGILPFYLTCGGLAALGICDSEHDTPAAPVSRL